MGARHAGCIVRDGRHSSRRTATACPSASEFRSTSISCPRWASSSRSRRRARLPLWHPKQRRQIMSEFDELPETFDPSTHEGTRDLEPFPPGWYPAQIVENSIECAKNGNGTYLLAVFEILSGEHKGRVYQNVTLQNVSQQAVEIGQRLLKD